MSSIEERRQPTMMIEEMKQWTRSHFETLFGCEQHIDPDGCLICHMGECRAECMVSFYSHRGDQACLVHDAQG